MKCLSILVGFFLVADLPAHADRAWVSENRFGEFHVVVAADAPEAEQTAATRFVNHWKETTGSEPTVSAEAVESAVNVWIGVAAQLAFPADFATRSPTADGGFVLTLPRRREKDDAPRDLLLAGGGPRGTLYAEWAFFEKFLGARIFAPGVLHFPKVHSIPSIDWSYEPAFEYRDTNYREFLENPWLAGLNSLNGQWSNVPERLGGHIGFVHGLAGHGHTFHDFVNPEEYFATHPEYFAEIDGERVKEAQLCLTNPDVLAITIDRAKRYLREAAPGERILSISQMDYFWFDSWCTCDKCRAVNDAEGSHSGTIIRFVNAVADAVKDEFPDALIDTFAYLYSRTPPKLTRPRDNVLIRLCAIDADYSRPMGDRSSPDNRAFVRDLKAWRRIAKHLYVWDYTQNWSAFQAPHPNLWVLQPNLAFYARAGVDGVYEQASPVSPHSDLEMLKAYLIGRGLRDPKFNWKKEYAAFLDAYYGPAAPYIDEYQRLLRDRLRKWGGPLYFVNDLDWMDGKTVEHAQEIFARAFSSTSDANLTDRLRAAYLPVQYAALVCPPDVAQRPDAYVFTRPAGPTFDEYWNATQALGVTHLNDYPIEQLRTRMKGETPPRYEVAPIEKLRNERFEVWVVPARGGAVVRWQEHETGRDWLVGFDHIRYPVGRVQEWATTDDDRWAEPEPIEQAYAVVARSGEALTLETQLDNGLVLRKEIRLTNEFMETHLEIRNSAEAAIVPKVWIGAEFITPPGSESSTPQGDHSIALRYPRVARTFAAEIVDGGPNDKIEVDRDARPGMTQALAKMDSAALAPGATRTLTVRHQVTAKKPSRLSLP